MEAIRLARDSHTTGVHVLRAAYHTEIMDETDAIIWNYVNTESWSRRLDSRCPDSIAFARPPSLTLGGQPLIIDEIDRYDIDILSKVYISSMSVSCHTH